MRRDDGTGLDSAQAARVTNERRERAKSVVRVLLGIVMVTMGVLHFARADDFAHVIPPMFPAPYWLVWISGVFEILGGIGILIPAGVLARGEPTQSGRARFADHSRRVLRTRSLAGWGLVLLYVAVFPANVYMAIEPIEVAGSVPDRWVMYARLPFQPLLMWIAWWCTRPPSK
jgi:uncharacterized membrane protein